MTTANYIYFSMTNSEPMRVADISSKQGYEIIQALEQVGPSPCEGCPYSGECMQGKACADFYSFVHEWDTSETRSKIINQMSKTDSRRVPLPEIYRSLYDDAYAFRATQEYMNDWIRAGEYYAVP